MASELLQGDPVELGGYRISGRLGAGGMGRVYLAFTSAGRPVALKVLRPELGDDPEFRQRFRQEITAAQRVSGLYTAQVLDADPDGSPPWLVTAYVPGESLAQAVAAHGPLPERSVLLLAAGVAEALQGIHATGLVHRDLKPSNVLLAADGPRVIDFGIARAAQAPALTRTGFFIGSVQFMSPEQVQGSPVTAAADVFALGGLAAYAATGRPPFGDGDAAAVMFRVLHGESDLTGCPGRLVALIKGCLAKHPSARPAPAQVIDRCRALSPAGALEFSASWLPAVVAADLPRQAASGTLPLPPPAPPAAPAAAAGSPMPAQSQAPPGNAPTAQFPAPVAAGPPGNTLTARSTAPFPPGEPGYRRRWSRAAVIASVGAGVLVAAIAGYGLAALASSHSPSSRSTSSRSTSSRSGSDKPTQPPSSAATQPPSAPATQPPSAPATQSPGAAAALDPCLRGTWLMTTESNRLPDGQYETYTDHGDTTTFLPDGTTRIDYGAGATSSTTVNGVTWTYLRRGSASGRYSTSHGTLRQFDMSGYIRQTEFKNGLYYSSSNWPVAANSGSQPYTCSSQTLQVSAPGGFTDVLTRQN